MPKFNDFDMAKWKELGDVWTDSLWLIDRRDNSGKHSGSYHGNFVPQIPRQFIKRFTRANDVVLDAFMGSGTTAYECETLGRNFVGIDIKNDMVEYVKNKLAEPTETDKLRDNFAICIAGDSTNATIYDRVQALLTKHERNNVQLVILHPPYFDILQFSDDPHDLSNAKNLDDFIEKFSAVVRNCANILERDRYLVVVIGDKYSAGQWYPLGFQCMAAAQAQGLKLKSIIIKNMDGNRGKQGRNDIWRYRALTSDYYIFKHEYILLFKKEERGGAI